jgi:hypothetical protein
MLMLMVGVRVLFNLELLVVASIGAPSGSGFFWVGFCIITWMSDSTLIAGSLDLGGVIEDMPISFWSQASLIEFKDIFVFNFEFRA